MGHSKKSFNTSENLLAARLDSRLKQVNTATVVTVKSVDTESKTVTVQPMIQMSDANNQAVDHALVNNIPYARLQGGSCGIICDPQVGDIGLVVFCSRDISNVVKNKKTTLAGSKRIHSISDGIYITSLLMEEPTIYLKIDADGVEIQGNVTVKGNIKATGDVKAGNISLQNHMHGNGNDGENTTKPLI